MQLANPSFDYTAISEDDASKLRCFEGELIGSRKRVANEIIRHGEILHGAQQVLASYNGGVFRSWLESQGISHQSGYNAINAFVAFGSCPNLDNLEVSAMYELSSCSPPIRKAALRLADKGVRVTRAMAKQLIESSEKGKPDGDPRSPTPRSTVAEDRDSSATAALAPEEYTEEDEDPFFDPEEYEDADDDTTYETTDGTAELARQRIKTKKTAEALMRALDELQELKPNHRHEESIHECRNILEIVEDWK